MKISTDENQIDAILSRGVENIYPDKDSLKKKLRSGQRLTIYAGFDPTGPVLHLGHSTTIRKLAQFQRLGHRVIFLFGDFTAQIGDPTDKLATRQPLTHRQVLQNLKNWKKQIKNLIDVSKVEFKFNSRWLAKLSFADLLKLSSYFTAQQTLARDMFKRRLKEGRDLYLNEFLYPLMQAYDSVAMDVDLEIGGNDQTFNMLAGRTLLKKMKNKDKFVLTTKLLTDPTGKKMGKTEGNLVALTDSPAEMYGKVMSWPDEMIASGLEILTEVPLAEVKELVQQLQDNKVNPRDLKMRLAREVVVVCQGERAARAAEDNFQRVFQQGEKPTKIPVVKIKDQDGQIGVLDLFVKAGLAKSNSDVRRLIAEGAIKIDDQKITAPELVVVIPESGLLLQKGKKRFARAVRQ